MTKIAGFGTGSESVPSSQRHGFADPDSHGSSTLLCRSPGEDDNFIARDAFTVSSLVAVSVVYPNPHGSALI
jgi:hypothetical protein